MTQKRIGKRLLCLMLAFCLMLSIVPISGITVLAGEEQTGYKVTFVKDEHVVVTVYPTQDLTQNGTTNLENIYARLSDTGEIDTSGDGQVNFTVTVAEGYVLNSIQATPKENYKNFKYPEELQIDAYRITKIKGDLTVTITTRSASGGDEDSCEHVYEDNWEVVQSPKCGVAGTEHRFCTQCGKGEQTQEIPALSHEYENDYCKFCGVIHPDKIVALNQIDFYIAKDSSNGLDGDVHVELKTSNNQFTGTIYLPGSVDLTKAFLKWNPSNSVIVKGSNQTQYTNGQAPIAAKGGSVTYTVTCGTNSASFTFTTQQGSENVQGMFFEIDESKGTIDAMNNDTNHETSCYGTTAFKDGEYHMSIKGRGNWTWTSGDKKPYNMTIFKDETYNKKAEAELIDGVVAKKWSLLANYSDSSLMRNKIGYDLACKLGIGLENRYIDIWMNGAYIGNYLMTPKSDYNAPENGYMLELDNNLDKEDPYFALDGLEAAGSSDNVITVKAVGDKAVEAGTTTEDIQFWMQTMLNAVMDTTSDRYTDYIDVDSWAKLYIIQEYCKNHDIICGSIFMHRDGLESSDKLVAGPIWDQDNAWGRVFFNDHNGISRDMQFSADGWYIDSISGQTSFLQYLGMHDDFMERVYSIFNENIDAMKDVSLEIDFLKTEIADSANMNFNIWKVNQSQYNAARFTSNTTRGSGTYAYNQVKTKTWDDYVSNLKTYVNTRYQFFSDNLLVSVPTSSLITGETKYNLFDILSLTTDCEADSYQWQSSTNGVTWANIEGATEKTYAATAKANMNGMQIRCIARNIGNMINTDRVAKVNACASVYLDPVTISVDMSGHIHEYAVVVTKPSCTEGGYTTHICACGDVYVDTYTEALNHNYKNGNCIHCGKAEFDGMIDFTSQESEKYYTIENQSAAKRTGNGLYLISTKDAFEPANDQLSGSSATTPKDVVKIPAEGDWTATIKVNFNQNSSQGYYEFFGFYAMDDYQNLVGIRAGDGSIQDFIRKNGTITKETSGKKTSTGLKSASTHYFRIKKSGDDYECYWSKDGENFTFIFSYEDTGITGETICLDAYSGMATGYTYQIEYLYLEKPVVPPTYREGDLNGDTVISMDDAVLAKRAAMKDPTLEITEAAIAAGDFNEDGKITVNEARRIMRMTMEQENTE